MLFDVLVSDVKVIWQGRLGFELFFFVTIFYMICNVEKYEYGVSCAVTCFKWFLLCP